MPDNELKNIVARIKESAESIVRECNKFKNHPEAVIEHGYAQEKADHIQFLIQKGREWRKQ